MCNGKKHSCESSCKSKDHCCQTTCRAEKMFGKKIDSLKKYVQHCTQSLTNNDKILLCVDEAKHVLKDHLEIKEDILAYLKTLQKKIQNGVKYVLDQPNLMAKAA